MQNLRKPHLVVSTECCTGVRAEARDAVRNVRRRGEVIMEREEADCGSLTAVERGWRLPKVR